MNTTQAILIVGGYGIVGQRIARLLAPDHPGRVIVAGRHIDQAGVLASELGHQARARAIDVRDPASIEAALDGVGTIVSCIDQPEPYVLEAAIQHGLGYTDITPHLMTRRPTDAQRQAAGKSGARIVLGAGLAPGISNVLARVVADRLGGAVERITSSVLLSIGDAFGAASRTYIMEEVSRPFDAFIDGRARRVLPFSDPVNVRFPLPLGMRTAYLFPFSDQVFFPATLGARTAVARLALDPPWLGSVARWLVQLRVTALLARRRDGSGPAQRVIAWLQAKSAGRNWYGLVIEADGPTGSARASLAGRGQADATAIGAAGIARVVIDGRVSEPGIWLAEQVVPPELFLEELARHAIVPNVEVAAATTEPSSLRIR